MEQRFSNAPLKIPKLACFSVFKTTQYPLLYRRDRSSLRGRRGEASVKLGLFYLIRFVQFSFILIQQGLLLIKKKILAPMRSNLHGNGDLVRLKERINLSRYPSPHCLPPQPPPPPPPLTMVSSRNCFLSAQRAPSEVLCSLLTCFLNLFSLKKRVVKKRVVV